MLKFCVVNEGEDQVYALSKCWSEFENGVSVRFILRVIFLDLFNFLLNELIAYNIITSHFGNQKHDLFYLVADAFLLLLEVCVDVSDHFFLEQLCFAFVLLDLLNLQVFLIESLLDLVDFGGKLFDLFDEFWRDLFAALVIGEFAFGSGFDVLEFGFNGLGKIVEIFFEL